MNNYVLPVLVGIGISLAISCLFDGGPMFLLASIVCTAGISLVIWLPLWWFVGTVILYFVGMGKFNSSQADVVKDLERAKKSLVNYIAREEFRGVKSRAEINDLLRQNGWSDAEIQQAYRAVNS
jgi:hypothetical protein